MFTAFSHSIKLGTDQAAITLKGDFSHLESSKPINAWQRLKSPRSSFFLLSTQSTGRNISMMRAAISQLIRVVIFLVCLKNDLN